MSRSVDNAIFRQKLFLSIGVTACLTLLVLGILEFADLSSLHIGTFGSIAMIVSSAILAIFLYRYYKQRKIICSLSSEGLTIRAFLPRELSFDFESDVFLDMDTFDDPSIGAASYGVELKKLCDFFKTYTKGSYCEIRFPQQPKCHYLVVRGPGEFEILDERAKRQEGSLKKKNIRFNPQKCLYGSSLS